MTPALNLYKDKMHTLTAAFTAFASIGITSAASNERVLGVYIFHRHGDRTAKSWPTVNLTALGADQVHNSGTFYRSRYISAGGDLHVAGLSSDVPLQAQLSISAPADAVLQNSAAAFAQALYPPSGVSETLANGSTIEAPLGGYQYIPVGAVTTGVTGKDAESSAWLQGSSGCNNAIVSSNNYFASSEYANTARESAAFYESLLPVVDGTFSADKATFKNAYTSASCHLLLTCLPENLAANLSVTNDSLGLDQCCHYPQLVDSCG